MTDALIDAECRSFRPAEWPAYLEFARLAWGKKAPQADPVRLSWLYEANPNTLGIEKDLLVLTEGDRIVGAHHRMRLPWRINGQSLILPSLHDLMVLPKFRRGGGFQLILAALAGENHAALFGLSEISDQIYQRMRVPAMPLTWLYKVRSKLRSGLQFAGSQLGFRAQYRVIDRTTTSVDGHEVLRVSQPVDSEISEGLHLETNAANHLEWNVASFRWRFFHELGPQNVMLLVRRYGQIVSRGVISVGVRKGVVVGRIVEVVSADDRALAAVSQAIDQAFDDLRIPLVFAVSNADSMVKALLQQGWKIRKEQIGCRWFSRTGQSRPQDLSIQGGGWDFGCDARRES